MEKFYLVALTAVLGAFDSAADAQDAGVKVLEKFPLYKDVFIINKAADLREEFTETQMRELRQILATAGVTSTVAIEKLRKEPQSNALFDDIVSSIEGGQYKNIPRPTPETERPPAAPPKIGKGLPARFPGGSKGYIRGKFPNVGDVLTEEELMDGCVYNRAGIATAISDLKSPKYCGGDGVFVVKRGKREDGTVIFTRES